MSRLVELRAYELWNGIAGCCIMFLTKSSSRSVRSSCFSRRVELDLSATRSSRMKKDGEVKYNNHQAMGKLWS